jgi:hypothetical protein
MVPKTHAFVHMLDRWFGRDERWRDASNVTGHSRGA